MFLTIYKKGNMMNKYIGKTLLSVTVAAFLTACGGGSVVDDIKDKAKDGMENTVEKTKDTAKDGVESAVEKAKETTENAVEKVVGEDDKESKGFDRADFVGKTYDMFNEDGTAFTYMPTMSFTEDKVNNMTPWKVENGIFMLPMFKMTFKLVKKSEDGTRIDFDLIKREDKEYTPGEKRYYFIKK